MTLTIRTDCPLVTNRAKMNATIAKYWNNLSQGWLTVWGPHIHHGYYEQTNNNLSPVQAQEILIEKLIHELALTDSCKILDVGCGLGGSAIYLAEKHQAIVHGISLSSKQISIATQMAHDKKLKNISFTIEDALSLNSFVHDSFDVIWSLESCEQFVDKKLFLEKAYKKLKSGGKLLLATWCSSEDQYEEAQAKQYRKLCQAFDLPYMPTINHYEHLLYQQGFTILKSLDWTEQVKQSWEIGQKLMTAYSFFQIIKMGGLRGLRFSKQLQLMQDAFNKKRIKYAVFVATKP